MPPSTPGCAEGNTHEAVAPTPTTPEDPPPPPDLGSDPSPPAELNLAEPGQNGLPPEVAQALYVASIKSWATAEEDITRALAAKYQQAPGLTPYRAPTGEELGYIQRTNPPPYWAVTNGAALDEYLRADTGNVETEENLDPPSADELIALVKEHRPEWLKPVTYVKPGVREAALAEVAESGKAIPGVTLQWPTGRLIVKAARGAREVFARMILAGGILPDGTAPPPADIGTPRRRPEIETRLPEIGTRVTTRMKDEADDAFDRGDPEPWWEPADPFAAVPVPADPFAGIEIER